MENVLYHHGVKGMKWGHRKARSSSNGTSRKGKRVAKIARNVAIAGAITAVAVGASRSILKKNGGVKLSSLKRSKSANDLKVKLLKNKVKKSNTLNRISSGNTINGRRVVTNKRDLKALHKAAKKRKSSNVSDVITNISYSPHKKKISAREYINTVSFR